MRSRLCYCTAAAIPLLEEGVQFWVAVVLGRVRHNCYPGLHILCDRLCRSRYLVQSPFSVGCSRTWPPPQESTGSTEFSRQNERNAPPATIPKSHRRAPQSVGATGGLSKRATLSPTNEGGASPQSSRVCLAVRLATMSGTPSKGSGSPCSTGMEQAFLEDRMRASGTGDGSPK